MPNLSVEEVLNVNVGVLGHVDSGKTSLVKALSTVLSTAALDKSKQSRETGMTLDLGFSCFVSDLPDHLRSSFPTKTTLQITLVDCPGHATLIRTIIGGAQIIDIALLVIDAVKGWQAQTTECLVLAELTSPFLIVALNKADQLPENERNELLRIAEQKVRQRLKATRFRNAPIVGVAACVGGEKVAARVGDAETYESYNVDTLVSTLKTSLPPPRRDQTEGPFYFSIDHCFPIRGRGTVITGTVLSGKIKVNDALEFPGLGLERKIKSMQMFKEQVPSIQQGDRAGVCVSNLDAKTLERGIASTPGAVRLLQGAIAIVRKVPYYKGSLKSETKFHISVGHTTVMATVTFWGAKEILSCSKTSSSDGDSDVAKKKNGKELVGSSSLGGDAGLAGLPKMSFDFEIPFVQQDALVESLDGHENTLNWALIDFQTPVHCPLESLIIGSRLDFVDNASGDSSSCRLAFSGRLMKEIVPEKDRQRLRIYNHKERQGIITKLGEPHKRLDDNKTVRYEVFVDQLFKKETNLKAFLGMKVILESGEIGEIKASYGTDGQVRIDFPSGTEANVGDVVSLPFRRYLYDPDKKMHQDIQIGPVRPGTRIEVQKKQKRVLPQGVKTFGEVLSMKGEPRADGLCETAIVGGFFSMEVDIKEYCGTTAKVVQTQETGSILGPFGKAGKCKVSFPDGISPDRVGSKIELVLE